MPGASKIDRVAHGLMGFWPIPRIIGDDFSVFYHEERLYSVRQIKNGMISLVYAENPYEAIEMVKNGGWKVDR